MLNPKARLFCKYWIDTCSMEISAYQSGYSNNIKNKVEFNDLTKLQVDALKKASTRLLQQKEVRKEIDRLYEIKIKEVGVLKYNDIFSDLSKIIRKGMSELSFVETKDILKAIELFFRYRPELGSNKDKGVYILFNLEDSGLQQEIKEARKQ